MLAKIIPIQSPGAGFKNHVSCIMSRVWCIMYPETFKADGLKGESSLFSDKTGVLKAFHEISGIV